jgi:pyruvate kinase
MTKLKKTAPNRDFKRTKIVATVGPASRKPGILEELCHAGVNVFRLNFSHGTHQSHLENIDNIKALRKKLDLPVAILQDLTGPKIRIGEISQEPLELNVNDEIILDSSLKEQSSRNRVGINHKNFAEDVFPGARLLLADGDLELKVAQVQPPQVRCKVIIGGSLFSHKGVNFPTGTFQLPALTEKDKKDLEFGIKNGVDMVALSFVRNAADIEGAREILRKYDYSIPVIAKIEKHEAIENIAEIMEASDAIMLARGDLGVEIDIERIPLVQKKIISLANRAGKPVITATQMLKSMVKAPRPTRAEVTDVANAILDGSDAIMLSEESAVGDYPERSVAMMKKIALNIENDYWEFRQKKEFEPEELTFTESVAYSAVVLSESVKARLIIAVTRSGYTARILAKFRPRSIIMALTPSEEVRNQLAMVWGVFSVRYDLQKDLKKLLRDAMEIADKSGLIQKGDAYVFTSGYPLAEPGSINQVTTGVYA